LRCRAGRSRSPVGCQPGASRVKGPRLRRRFAPLTHPARSGRGHRPPPVGEEQLPNDRAGGDAIEQP